MDTSNQSVLSWSLGLPPEADLRPCHTKHATRRPVSTKPFIVHVLPTCKSSLLWAEWSMRGASAAVMLKPKFIKFRQGVSVKTSCQGNRSESSGLKPHNEAENCVCCVLVSWAVGSCDLNKKALRWSGSLADLECVRCVRSVESNRKVWFLLVFY